MKLATFLVEKKVTKAIALVSLRTQGYFLNSVIIY